VMARDKATQVQAIFPIVAFRAAFLCIMDSLLVGRSWPG
jgi:hypothetical protein